MKDSRIYALTSATMLTLLVSACAPYKPGSYNSGTCNQLNSQMIFGGNTANSRKADIQMAEMPLVAESYRKDGCEK